MIDHFFRLDFASGRGLQEQLREGLVSAILAGGFPADEPLPSCRKLASQLRVSRNTVNLVYESLIDHGYLVSKPRKGFFLHADYADGGQGPGFPRHSLSAAASGAGDPSGPDWAARFKLRPGAKPIVDRPRDWADFPYPFVYGQPMHGLFPLDHWREASRRSLSRDNAQTWHRDRFDRDDEMLIEQLRTRVLPKRGIWARPEEILVTLGSQNALYLLASLLMNRRTSVAVETPGFRDAASIFELHGAQVRPHGLDEGGIVVDERLDDCDYIYLTPSHQVPTGISMSAARRTKLLAQARGRDQIIIEDDYDAELNLDADALPAIKASDASGRVVYISSLSKPFSPGLRIGYLVADAALVEELRALRRLMYRHPPLNNQRMLAEFLSQGYYDAHLRRFRAEHRHRRDLLAEALGRDLESCRQIGHPSASAFWLAAPEGVDTRKLSHTAARRGVVFEYGEQFFFEGAAPKNCMRLGFNAIATSRISEGIGMLAGAMDAL
ncbi:PLP-dependent aminotransferase family protein [Aureimonas populi]|uniref:PLP-dependent aminotransferase family protein n=1 Tax=Aureimonas populi TaxID=1701758 RepID=A0ABW5CJF5_9HYPH|nr:PLP-dependent aminotransferase family protein [Aureimonas populi]